MSLDVVAVPRSHRVVLAVVVGRSEDGTTLELVAEDGARFRFPAERALARCTAASDEDDPCAALAGLRQRLAPFDGWLALRGELEDGASLTAPEIARRLGRDDGTGVLDVALGMAGAAPWFRRNGVVLIAVPMREALEQLYHIHDAAARDAGEALVRRWWPDRGAGVPDGWLDPGGAVELRARVAMERARYFELDYVPDEEVAAAAALDALSSWALGGDVADSTRGKELARSLGLPDEPDQVLEHLVACGLLPADVEPAPHRAGLADDFPDDALEESRTIAAQPRGGSREDLTHEFTVAVDDADTREVDDALTLRRVGDAVELLVHIADVAAHVAPGTALDAVVRSRASSLFLPDHSVLMFPPELVVDHMSLAVGDARPALTGIFRLGAEGHVDELRFVRSTVRLTRRVTYDETRDPAALGPDADTGRLLVHVCEALRGARERRGARILRLPSPKVLVRDGVPAVALRMQDAPGDVAVSEAMVLLNTCAGERLAAAGAPALYRGQSADVPSGRRVPEPGDPLYASRIRRTFAPTETSVDPLEHAGLGAPVYVQSSSPLRRYADLVNQRQLAAVVTGESPPHTRDEIQDLVPYLHDRERAVRQAADSRTQYWVARAVEASGARTLHGVLSKAPRRGLGSVWVPELCRELPLRAPKGWRPPAEGTAADWRIGAVRPYRGRIELAPADG